MAKALSRYIQHPGDRPSNAGVSETNPGSMTQTRRAADRRVGDNPSLVETFEQSKDSQKHPEASDTVKEDLSVFEIYGLDANTPELPAVAIPNEEESSKTEVLNESPLLDTPVLERPVSENHATASTKGAFGAVVMRGMVATVIVAIAFWGSYELLKLFGFDGHFQIYGF